MHEQVHKYIHVEDKTRRNKKQETLQGIQDKFFKFALQEIRLKRWPLILYHKLLPIKMLDHCDGSAFQKTRKKMFIHGSIETCTSVGVGRGRGEGCAKIK